MKAYFTRRNLFIFTLVAGTLILLLVPLMRMLYFNALLVGDESYYHARIAQSIIKSGIPERDEAILGGRPYVIEPYHVVLSWIGYIIGIEFASQLLPFLSGVIALLLFFLILQQLSIQYEQQFYILLALILSPPFLGIFTYSNPAALSILFSLAAICLFIKEDMLYFTLSFFFLIASSLFSLIAPLVTLLVLLSYALYRKKLLRHYFLLAVVTMTFIAVYAAVIYWNYGLPQNTELLREDFIQRMLSDLGGKFGFSIFSLILCSIGIAFTWDRKKQLAPIYIGTALLFFLAVFYSLAIVYLNFIVSIFSGISIHRLLKRTWMLYLIKELTILAIFCGLLFSATSYINRLAITNPSTEVVESLVWLNGNSRRNEVVLSHYTKGYWIEYLAERKVMTDSNIGYILDAPERLEASNSIFMNRSLRDVKKRLNLYNITYIWIDDSMVNGQVWSRQDEGLLYLLNNNQTFRNIYYERGISIWKYLGES
ncbi:hypothetical protein HYV81_03715 [Candidatus Woesearchaeota archaeon]|nr:hypothetical protein [Candidatus Woesearchaeota archaeon]